MEPGLFRDCDNLVRNLQGRLELLAVNVHVDSDTQVDHYDDHEDQIASLRKDSKDPVGQLSDKLETQSLSAASGTSDGDVKQNRCSTCNAIVGDSKEYREHFKSEWHKHNLKRKTKQLPPLTAEECMADLDLDDTKADLKDYFF